MVRKLGGKPGTGTEFKKKYSAAKELINAGLFYCSFSVLMNIFEFDKLNHTARKHVGPCVRGTVVQTC